MSQRDRRVFGSNFISHAKEKSVFFDIAIILSVVSSIILLVCVKTLAKQTFIVFFEFIFLFAMLILKYNLIGDIKRSYFVQAFINNQGLCIAALIVAAICLLVSYPGNLYSDSYGRFGLVKKLKQITYDAIKGHPQNVSSWLNVTPTLFMAFFYYLTGNLASYAFAQAFFFFYVTMILVKRLCKRCRFLAYILFASNPVFFCVSTYYEIAVGCAIGVAALVLLLTIDESKLKPLDKILQALLIAFSGYVTFGFRYNAFTMIPVFVVLAYFFQRSMRGKIVAIVVLFLGLLFVAVIPKFLNIKPLSRSCDGFIWKMGTTFARMPPEKYERNKCYLDDFFGDGSTERLANGLKSLYGSDNFNTNICYMFDIEGFSVGNMTNVGLKKIFQKYILLFLKEPKAAINTELLFGAYVLGIPPRQIYLWEWDYDRWERGREFGLNDSKMRHRFMDAYRIVVERTYIPLHPWLMLLITCFFVFIKLKFFRIKILDSLEAWLILLAIFYYGAFVINTQSMEFRYFYPAFYCLALADISCISAFAGEGLSKIKEVVAKCQRQS